jgi:Domain of unknown function (DUF4062)
LGTKRYQVFVSSTFRDLQAERERVLRALAEGTYIAAGMEYFPAIDEEQFRYIKAVIDESDYYVTIVAGMYGSLAPDGLSYTEKEYEYALERSMPVIALIRQNIQSLDPAKRETTSDKLALLERFRTTLSTGRLVRYWNDETELCYRLVNSLATTSLKYPRDGWVKGKEDPETLLRRILELEESNKQLEIQIASLRDAPMVDHVREQLRRKIVQVKYKRTDGDGSLTDVSDNLNALDVAQAILPQMGFISRNKWGEITHKEFSETVRKFIRSIKGVECEIVDRTVVEIRDLLGNFGLVQLSATNSGDYLVMITSPGYRLVKDELIKRFPPQSVEYVTAGKIARDVKTLVKRMFS